MNVSLSLQRREEVEPRVADHLAGRHELTGLELYYELERATSLMELHGMLRAGPGNRSRSGLQQSYGDHNRLLLLGLDRLLAGDAAWYRTRVAPGEELSDARLGMLTDQVARLGLDARAQVALWLGAALHDCGMIAGRGSHLDVEDGVVIGRPVLDALCPPELVDLALFAVRHHDYIKDVFLGDAPVALVADDLAELPEAQRPTALALLGMIQVAGAASLGEGRLSAFRVDIFERCFDGSALRESSVEVRAGRLLRASVDTTDTPSPSARAIDGSMTELLARVPLHGWQKAAAALGEQSRWAGLEGIAAAWRSEGGDHVSLATPLDGEVEVLATTVAMNGTEVLVLGG